MGRSTTKWYLIDNGDGTFDVQRRGRPVLVDVPRTRAVRYIRDKATRSEPVYEVEPDGYQTKMRTVS